MENCGSVLRKILRVSKYKQRVNFVPRPILIFDILVTQARPVHALVVNGTVTGDLFRNEKIQPCKRTFVTKSPKMLVNLFLSSFLPTFISVRKHVLQMLLLPIVLLSVFVSILVAVSLKHCSNIVDCADIVHVI